MSKKLTSFTASYKFVRAKPNHKIVEECKGREKRETN